MSPTPAAPTPVATAIVLAGKEATSLRNALEERLAHTGKPLPRLFETDSILEAVLLSGNADEDSDQPSPHIPLVIAGVSQELEQLEPAVRSLRKVYPQARIILACAPEDEVPCRKAKVWGATDYIIVPADHASLQQLATLAPLRSRTADASQAAGRRAPADALREVVAVDAHTLPARLAPAPSDLQMPAMPLALQTSLLTDLISGRSDFADRALAALQTHIQWNGILRFLPAGAVLQKEPRPNEQRVAVAVPDQPPFGELLLETATPPPGPGPGPAGAALAQAAHWFAALLAAGRRYEQLRSLAITDELSGAYNRRYFSKFMAGLLERAKVGRFRVTLLLFDIDDFKQYNDRFGHAAGDAIIRELIKLLRACTRPHDIVARLGGDEFAVVFWDNEAPRQPNSEHPRDAIAATDRFRKAIKNHHWPEICKIQGEVSISGGLATFPWDADTLEILIERADEALLRAKAAGKNAILLHGENCPPSTAEELQR